ncbi:hypothetical protein KW787_00490 [Candidatus Pacearchaeota archaeon]|nr:hypothetical protein [Candidatus Pacearchaeota archaeon]
MQDKRGQDLSITTLILIILGIVVLVFIILGFYMGWDYIFGKIGLAPGQSLETLAQSCKVSNEANLQLDFCQVKKTKIDGVTEYVNCMDPRLQGSIGSTKIVCPKGATDPRVVKCQELIADSSYNGKSKVNNQLVASNSNCTSLFA